jgi:hypothetical protein
VTAAIAAMTRQAHDGGLIALYQDTLNLETGNYTDAPSLPLRITEAIQNGQDQIDLGKGHRLRVTSGLALDVGFTAAYENKGAGMAGKVTNPMRLKAVTETCVSQRGTNKVCFAAGYIQGAAAYAASRQGT